MPQFQEVLIVSTVMNSTGNYKVNNN